ncbi:MAG: aminopeptidase P family protein [Desulfomonile tiedjei]|nr:aminopeptidase P family protein [Desulfomonile tiedjei]
MKNRATAFHRRLEKLGLDAVMFNTSEFSASPNVTYLSGFTGSDATILITPTERHLFTDGRYKTQAKQQAAGFQIHVVRSKLDALANALKGAELRRLGMEGSRISYDFVTALVRRFPDLQPIPLKRQFVEGLRIVKDGEEKAKIKAAAHLASEACRRVVAAGLIGRIESEVAADLEGEFRRLGAEKIAFDTIVASGERSALPHGKASTKRIGNQELVVVDYGCMLEGYHSDETVTCVTDAPSVEQKRIYDVVYQAHMRALEVIKPGIHARRVDAAARKVIADGGYGKHFLHGLGHGVGLEIHEPPYLSPRGRGTLEEGMVFTVEPGVYVEGVGGVRLESLIYLDRNGPDILSEMPKDLIRVG